MAWAAITEADLMEYLSGQELESFRRATQRPGESDPVAGIIGKVTDLVRASIMACPRYTLAADGTIPDVLQDAACSIAVVKIMARAGGAILDPSGERRKASEAARQTLRDVASGKGPGIPVPTVLEGTGTETAAPGVVPVQYYPPVDSAGNDMTHEFDYESQDGI